MRIIKLIFLIVFCVSSTFAQKISAIVAVSSGYTNVTLPNVYITSWSIDPLNRYVIIYFNEPVYSSSDLTGIKTSDLQITFTQNGGTATNTTIASVKTIANGTLAGGEMSIRVNLTLTGSASGVESIEIKPSSSTAITNNLLGKSELVKNTATSLLNLTYNSDYQGVLTYAIDDLNCVVPHKDYRTIENQWVADIVALEWSTLDRIYRLSKYGDKNYALIEWQTPGSGTQLVNANSSLTWVRETGFTFGSPGYLETGWVPSGNFTLNDCGIFTATETDVSDGSFDYGTAHSDADASKRIGLSPRNGTSGSIGLNSGVGTVGSSITTTLNCTFLNDRVSSANTGHDFYYNGTLNDGQSFVSVAIPDQALVIGARRIANGTIANHTTRRVSLLMAGASMGTNAAGLNTAESTYRSSNASVVTSTQITTDGGTDITTSLNTLKTD